MIRKVFLSIVIVILLVLVGLLFISSSQNSPERLARKVCSGLAQDDSIQGSSQWFWKDGRTFIFDIIYMNMLPMGSAHILISDVKMDNKQYISIKAEAKPFDFFTRIYKVKASANSLIDKKTFKPFLYSEYVETEGKIKEKEVRFDQVKHIAISGERKYKLSSDEFDPLSSFIILFGEDFSKEQVKINLFSYGEAYDLVAKTVSKKGDIYRLSGSMERANKSNASHSARFDMWVIDDGKVKIPLLMKVYSPAGIVIVRIKEVK